MPERTRSPQIEGNHIVRDGTMTTTGDQGIKHLGVIGDMTGETRPMMLIRGKNAGIQMDIESIGIKGGSEAGIITAGSTRSLVDSPTKAGHMFIERHIESRDVNNAHTVNRDRTKIGSHIKIASWNARSLKRDFSKIQNILDLDCEIILIQET